MINCEQCHNAKSEECKTCSNNGLYSDKYIPVLKPCPFCGSKVELRAQRHPTYFWYWVNCDKCKQVFFGNSDKQKLIAKWNERKAEGDRKWIFGTKE